MKKKVCILSNGLARGGTDTFVINLLKHLDESTYEKILILSVDQGSVQLRESELVTTGTRVVKTSGLNSTKNKLVHLIRLYRILRDEKPDVFQTNIDLFNGPNLLVAWAAGVPIRICHSHNTMQEREVVTGKNYAIIIYQMIMRWMCWHFSNRRAGCSPEALDFLFTNKWKKDKNSTVVYNGIDVSEFRTDIDKKKKLLEIGASNRLNVLTVGRIAAQKNPYFILEVFKDLLSYSKNINLIWVGTGNMEQQIKKKATELGVKENIIFLGIRNDVNELMQSSDVFLFPSIFEGLGIVVVEAQAAGLPCLLSNKIPQMVNCGGCSFMSLSTPSQKWAEELYNMLSHGAQYTVNEDLIQQFSVKHMVEQMEGLFI